MITIIIYYKTICYKNYHLKCTEYLTFLKNNKYKMRTLFLKELYNKLSTFNTANIKN